MHVDISVVNTGQFYSAESEESGGLVRVDGRIRKQKPASPN